jgi:hypothetical protein
MPLLSTLITDAGIQFRSHVASYGAIYCSGDACANNNELINNMQRWYRTCPKCKRTFCLPCIWPSWWWSNDIIGPFTCTCSYCSALLITKYHNDRLPRYTYDDHDVTHHAAIDNNATPATVTAASTSTRVSLPPLYICSMHCRENCTAK